MKRVIKNLLKFLFLPFYNRYRLVINKLDGINDRFDDINVTQKDNESLQQENNTLNECLYKTNIEKEMLNKQLTYKTYLLDRFDELHEDVVQSSWGGGGDKINRKYFACKNPFATVRIQSNGDVLTCYADALKVSNQIYTIGNIFKDSFDNIWNSDKVKKLRYSVAHGNFDYCSSNCTTLSSQEVTGNLINRETSGYNFKKWQDCTSNESPSNINLEICSSCNLKCFMCAIEHFDDDENDGKIKTILENFVRPSLKICKNIIFDTNGEFLTNKSYLNFLETINKSDYPSLQLTFFTNGILLTKEWFEKFDHLLKVGIRLQISIDAATKETYEKYRVGGKWETLCNNLEFISSLRATNKILYLKPSFVVHSGNYHEMEDFVKLCKKWNSDMVHFQRLTSTYRFSRESFIQSDVFHHENPLRDEAIKIMTRLERETNGIKFLKNGFPV